MKGGYVYFVASPEQPDLVKIGRTRGVPSGRLRELQSGCPVPLVLLAAFPAVSERDLAEAEVGLHRLFAPERKHGEWFERSCHVDGAIEAILQTFGECDSRGVPEYQARRDAWAARCKEARLAWDTSVRAWLDCYSDVLVGEPQAKARAEWAVKVPVPFEIRGSDSLTGLDVVERLSELMGHGWLGPMRVAA